MLQRDRIKIRTIRRSELELVYGLSFDFSDAGEYMPVALMSEADFRAEYDRNGFWRETKGRLIIENIEGDIVGEIGCFEIAHYMDGREIYYRTYSGHRRKGYAREALKVFVNFFFQSTALNRLQAVTVHDNEVSASMLKRAGFQFEGTLRGARWFKGRLVDLNVHSCLRSEWAHYETLNRTAKPSPRSGSTAG